MTLSLSGKHQIWIRERIKLLNNDIYKDIIEK